MKRQIIIDCDPGVDDAVALFLAFASPELDILAVTTVGGNVPAELTARNARIIRQIAGREDVPVFMGAARPLSREPSGAGEFHGETGLGRLALFEPAAPTAEGSSAEVIVRSVMARPEGSVSVAVLGPLTNLALAMEMEPRLAAHLGSVAVMGGASREGGNITPSAEFNIWADPEAADIVLRSGARTTLFGLDVTHRVRATAERVAAIEALPTPQAKATTELLRFSNEAEAFWAGGEAAPLHDPCVIAAVLQPGLFQTQPCAIRVETQDETARGQTVVDFDADPTTARHCWAVEADAPGVFALLNERLARPE